MKRLIIAAAALALTGGVGHAQNDAPQGDYEQWSANGSAEGNVDLSMPDMGIDFGTTASIETGQPAGTEASEAYPGSVGGR